MPKHIVRLIGLIFAGIAIGAFAKWYFTVDTFYEYGHYRAQAVAELAALEPVFQTPRYCQGCHNERHAQWSANNHKSVSCEVCHGPAQGHPRKGKLPIPADAVKLCTLCHEAMPERPRTQPQIVVAQHNPYATSGQQCTACHNPHAPKLAGVIAPKVDGNAAAGSQKHTAACATCHGAKGISPNETWPDLAGQNAAYLVRILAAYKSGAQTDVMMSPVAKTLSDFEIQNLAVFYAGLSCSATAAKGTGGDAVAGKALADRNCASCHGPTGIGANPAWPKIAGQKAVYLTNTLKAFRAGLRKDPMMAGVSRGLSDADIANLAAYYAAQSCRPAVQAGGRP
jgi:cytochrome c553